MKADQPKQRLVHEVVQSCMQSCIPGLSSTACVVLMVAAFRVRLPSASEMGCLGTSMGC